jgi:hypothetical protein
MGAYLKVARKRTLFALKLKVRRSAMALLLAILTTSAGYAQKQQVRKPSAAVNPAVISSGGPVTDKAGTKTETLAAGFRNPPASSKPRTWWHWTNGNVTESGITKDLEWMRRSGIGGFQLVDVAAGGGQTVEPKINFGTEEWYHAVRHSAEEANRLGLEMSIFSCAGWSEAGGPWVTQPMAMKRVVWSETVVEGPAKLSVKLAEPPSNEGPVRDSNAGAKPDAPHFYRDSAVIAYRTPADAVSTQSPARITTNNGPIDGTPLLDGSLTTSITISAPTEGAPAWMQF